MVFAWSFFKAWFYEVLVQCCHISHFATQKKSPSCPICSSGPKIVERARVWDNKREKRFSFFWISISLETSMKNIRKILVLWVQEEQLHIWVWWKTWKELAFQESWSSINKTPCRYQQRPGACAAMSKLRKFTESDPIREGD